MAEAEDVYEKMVEAEDVYKKMVEEYFKVRESCREENRGWKKGFNSPQNLVVDVVPNANTFTPPITRSSARRELSSRPHAYTRLFTGCDSPHEENVDLVVDGVQATREAVVEA